MKMFSAALSMHCVWELMLPDAEPPSSSADCVCCRADQADGAVPWASAREACGISWDPRNHPCARCCLQPTLQTGRLKF